MVKWLRLTKHQHLGFFALGLVFFALQELPYMVMPFIPLKSNPLMQMQDKSIVMNVTEKILGVSCVVIMLFLVRNDLKWFSIYSLKEFIFLSLAVLVIIVYFIGWFFYYRGYQSLSLILCALVAPPPIYYIFIGLWRRNYVLSVLASLFLLAHLLNVWNNLKQQ